MVEQCDAVIVIHDDRWGKFRSQCQGESGHEGQHFVDYTACEPEARLVWPVGGEVSRDD